MDSAGKSGGSRLSSALGSVLKKSALGIGAAAGGILGTALFKGFERLSAIDEAQAKLKGLGNSTKTVTKIMDDALASVKGTAFGLGDAATVAAGAIASGIKPGKELTANLKLVADAATIAGVPLNEMGAIFNKVAASGKLQGDVIAQLGDKGIPILQLLGKEIGKTPAEVSKLASQGKIDFETFSKAMQDGLGGAALKSGNTFKGALANMQAALGRLGASLLKDLFPIAKRVFGGVTTLLDKVTAQVDPAQRAISDFFKTGAGHAPAVAAIDKIRDAASHIGDGFKTSIKRLDEFKTKLGTLDLDNLDGKKIGAALSLAATTALESVAGLGVKVAAAFGKMIKDVDWVGVGIKAGPAVLGLVVGLATGLLNGITDPTLWQQIWDHGFDIAIAALAIAFAPGKVADALGGILLKVPFAGRFLKAIVDGLQAFGGKITEAGAALLRVFWRGFTEAPLGGLGTLVGRILTALGEIPGAVKNFLDLLKTHIGVWALDTFESIGRGARGAVPSLLSFVASIPGKILSALGSLLRLLLPRGGEAVDGLTSGIRSRIASATSLAKTIPGRIRDAVGDLGHLLYGAGTKLVGGLIDGMKAMLGKVADVAGSIANKVKGFFPGSPIKEGPLTSWNNGGAGQRLGLLLADGLRASRADIALASGRLASSVAVPRPARFDASSIGSVAAGALDTGRDGGPVQIELIGAGHMNDSFQGVVRDRSNRMVSR